MVYGELKRKELVGEVTCTVPPSVAAPVTLTRSELVPDTSTKYVAAAVNTRLPLTVSVPIEFPGPSVPPLLVVLPTLPLPTSVAPALTVTRRGEVVLPSTARRRPRTWAHRPTLRGAA